MNKQKPILYKLAIAAMFLTVAACKKKEDDIRYYQQYWISYYKTQNSYDASAIFFVGNANGKRILLDGNPSIKLNNAEPWLSPGDFSTYRWNGAGMPDAEFALKEHSGTVYSNTFKKSAVPDIEILQIDSVVSKANGCTVVVSGGPITNSDVESADISVVGITGSNNKPFAGDTVYLTPYLLERMSPGKVTVVVSRTKKMPVTSSDGAGGMMSMTIHVEKEIMLTE